VVPLPTEDPAHGQIEIGFKAGRSNTGFDRMPERLCCAHSPSRPLGEAEGVGETEMAGSRTKDECLDNLS
jgi:hypothetical protein